MIKYGLLKCCASVLLNKFVSQIRILQFVVHRCIILHSERLYVVFFWRSCDSNHGNVIAYEEIRHVQKHVEEIKFADI